MSGQEQLAHRMMIEGVNFRQAMACASVAIDWSEQRDRRELAAMRERAEKAERFAAAGIDAMWHDCHVEGERGANTCGLEGTHICTLCQLADAKRSLAAMTAAKNKALEALKKALLPCEQCRYMDNGCHGEAPIDEPCRMRKDQDRLISELEKV